MVLLRFIRRPEADVHDEHEIHGCKKEVNGSGLPNAGLHKVPTPQVEDWEVDGVDILQGFHTAVGGVRGALGIRQKLVALVEKRALINDLQTAAYQDMALITSAVCQALVAARLGRLPDDQEVLTFLESLLHQPRARARLHRLFIEGAKSPDNDRKAILATALIHPGVANESTQDRVDSALERLFVEDIRLAASIQRLVPNEELAFLAEGCGLCFIGKYPLHDPPDLPGWIELARMGIDRPSLYAVNGLRQSGCITMGSPVGLAQKLEIYQSNLSLTVLGKAVLESVEVASRELLKGVTCLNAMR